MEHVDDVPVALFVELTSDIQRLPDDSRERPILGVALPLISVDAMTASAPSKVARGARPARPQVLMARRGTAACLPRLLLVTGMSGAGKSTVLDALEDIGWDCVDNLPAPLLEDYVVHGERDARPQGAGRGRHGRPQPRLRSRGLAWPSSARSKASRPKSSISTAPGPSSSAATTRPAAAIRSPPTGRPRTASPASASFTAPLRSAADSVLDTTDLTPAELRDELRRRYGGDVDQPVLTIASFGFARGMSRTADLVFDMRFIANPHWVDELRPLTGLDAAGPGLYRAGRGLGAGDGPHRGASHRLDSPLLGRRQNLSDGGIRLYRRAPPLGRRGR